MNHGTLNISSFRSMFPAYVSETTYPDMVINAWYAAAGAYISQDDNPTGLTGPVLDLALQLLTAHLLRIASQMTSGQDVGFIQSATTEDVTTALAVPPFKSGWEYWLSSTGYGLELWSLLQAGAAGGWSVGGGPETNAFRKVAGFF